MSNTYETAYRTIDDTIQIVAVWRGGIYIDLFWGHNLESAFEVINVYDYRAGKIQDNVNVSKELTEWIKSTGKAEIRNYYRHTA
ncbi:hypothetical protein SEA_LIFES_119 [Microbacterium phage Lifes]|nr:hypothetical protein SEA_LIFES_119 [Microbacterium phage Lifes]